MREPYNVDKLRHAIGTYDWNDVFCDVEKPVLSI